MWCWWEHAALRLVRVPCVMCPLSDLKLYSRCNSPQPHNISRLTMAANNQLLNITVQDACDILEQMFANHIPDDVDDTPILQECLRLVRGRSEVVSLLESTHLGTLISQGNPVERLHDVQSDPERVVLWHAGAQGRPPLDWGRIPVDTMAVLYAIVVERDGVFVTVYVGYTGNFSARLYQHRSCGIGGPVGQSALSMHIYQRSYWGADATVAIVILAQLDGEMVDPTWRAPSTSSARPMSSRRPLRWVSCPCFLLLLLLVVVVSVAPLIARLSTSTHYSLPQAAALIRSAETVAITIMDAWQQRPGGQPGSGCNRSVPIFELPLRSFKEMSEANTRAYATVSRTV